MLPPPEPPDGRLASAMPVLPGLGISIFKLGGSLGLIKKEKGKKEEKQWGWGAGHSGQRDVPRCPRQLNSSHARPRPGQERTTATGSAEGAQPVLSAEPRLGTHSHPPLCIECHPSFKRCQRDVLFLVSSLRAAQRRTGPCCAGAGKETSQSPIPAGTDLSFAPSPSHASPDMQLARRPCPGEAPRPLCAHTSLRQGLLHGLPVPEGTWPVLATGQEGLTPSGTSQGLQPAYSEGKPVLLEAGGGTHGALGLESSHPQGSVLPLASRVALNMLSGLSRPQLAPPPLNWGCQCPLRLPVGVK